MGPDTRYGRATGAYQFIRSTWQSVCDCPEYPEARDAPDHIQDQVASQLMLEYFDRWNDYGIVAAGWHGGPGAAQRMADTGSASTSDGYTHTDEYVRRVLAAALELRPAA